MTTYFGACSSLTGGGAGALDAIAISSIADGDIEFVATGSTLYVYKFNATATDAEASPSRIRPDSYSTAGVWYLQTVSQTAGPVAVQVFTASGTYTKTPGATVAIVELVGGGGGGAGCISGQYGSSGSAGGYARKRISLASVTTETVTIGAAGAGGIGAADGVAGGTTSFGAHCSATGGGKGKYNASAGQGGIGTGGDINIRGGQGGSPGTGGANSMFGDGGSINSSVPTFYAGTGYGGGGSGTTGSSTYTGGAGSAGIVIVTEY